MTTFESSSQLSRLLTKLSESLDISDSNYEKARASYQSLGKWLNRDGAAVEQHSSDIYPQGSFRLGTVIKPISNADEYDVDVVCQLDLSTGDVSQKALKDLVGADIKAYAEANGMNEPPEAGRRCWTLNYADGAQFHMDILPAVGDDESFTEMLRIAETSADWTQYAIAITDRTLPNYNQIDPDWPRSNPRGYAEWFQYRMEAQFENQRKIFADSHKMNIEDVPDYKIKTPLQRSIQLLKRHRDMMFVDDQDDKPISIIITTLAAHAYENQSNLLEAIQSIVADMPDFIVERNGVSWIPNPVNPLENFADKWQEHPQREAKCRRWIDQVREDLSSALESRSLDEMAGKLESRFGEHTVRETVERFKPSASPQAATVTVPAAKQFDVPHRESPPWPGNPKSSVKITARYAKSGHKMPFESDSDPLPKYADLYFRANADVSGPFDVYWQVINTGKEAKDDGGLRGSIFPSRTAGRGGLKQKESTLYTGSHAILCFIVQDGVCVARSREFIVNIK